VVIEGRDYAGTVIIAALFGALVVAIAYFSSDWSGLPVQLGYLAGTQGCLLWPLFVMLRHRRRQDKLLDQIRATYVLATGDLMAGRVRAAARRLKKIRGLEQLWRFGANYVFRGALLSYVFASNFALAFAGQFFGYRLDTYRPKTLSDTWHQFIQHPWLFLLCGGMALFFALPSALNSAQIKSRPWAEFYGDRLKAALKAGRGINTAPQHEGPELPDGVSARELLGLNPGFTKVQLRRAWLRLAKELHPDRWSLAVEGVRRMKEAGLKRVNVARDELVGQAI
jgi:hypothetical protein